MKALSKGKIKWKNVPNCITSFRIVGTVCLLFMEPFSMAFYVLYGLCGFSDILDGWIARKTGTTSALGSKLDSIADLLLYTLILLRIFPVLWARLPRWIWYLVGGALLLRAASYGTVAVRYRRFASLHTYLNKATGLSVFLVPYLVMGSQATLLCAIVCVVALVGSVEELLIHLCTNTYQEGVHTIIQLKK